MFQKENIINSYTRIYVLLIMESSDVSYVLQADTRADIYWYEWQVFVIAHMNE